MSAPAIRLAGDRISMRVRPRALIACLGLLAAAAVMVLVNIRFGDPPVSVSATFRALQGNADFADQFILKEILLPRIVVALLVGLALGMSGAIFQSLSRNALGSPDIIGFTSGAATGAVVAMLYLHAASFGISVAAVIGGVATALLVYLLSWKRGIRGYRLVLVGIGITAILGSVNSYLITRAGLLEAVDAQIWLYGSLNSRNWDHVRFLLISVVVLLPVLSLLSKRLDLLEMGDDAAKALGIPVERTRLLFIVLGTALPAVAIAAAGPIGFIALAAPHLARRLTRTAGANMLAAGCMGAFLLVTADWLAQTAIPSTRLPVGLATAALGGAYLVWLLASEWRRGGRTQ